MSNQKQLPETIRVEVGGIGGIDSTEVTLQRGVNLLEGRNATNRTSFLQALMAALGSDNVSLKGDRDEGYVELSVGDETYRRQLERKNGTMQFRGEPYLSGTTEADLFAFLLESNEVRRAVRAGEDLRDVIMRPVDTTEIDRQIRDLRNKRGDIDETTERLERQLEKLPHLQKKQTEIEEDLAKKRAELADIQEEIETINADVETKKGEQDQLEATLQELTEARSELESVEFRLDTEQEALASARAELEAVADRKEEYDEPSDDRLGEIEEQVNRLRQQKRACDTRVSKLHRIVQFNEEMLEGGGFLGNLFEETGGDDVTEKFLTDTEATCWTCGSSVEKRAIEEILERLRELSKSQRRERNRLDDELDDLIEERDRRKNARQQLRELSEKRASLEADIERKAETIESLEAEREALHDRIENLEDEAEQLEEQSQSRILELHKTASEKEVEIQRLERKLKDVTDEITELDAQTERIEGLEERRTQVTEELQELRTRIDRVEKVAIEAFNEHMGALVDLLEYNNLDRVWIERQNTGGVNQNRESTFTLHIVRTTEDGTTYEDRMDHLSESEREVIGLVFALAGYLVHEVFDTLPFILLDSLEAIDAERIGHLIEYLAEYAPTVVAALLPEDTQMLDESYLRINEI